MTNAEARFNKIHIRKVHACLAVTCHLHFWQNDRELLRATAVTWEWNGYRNKSQHRKVTLGKKILPPLLPHLSVTSLQRQGGRIRWSYCAEDGLFIDLTMNIFFFRIVSNIMTALESKSDTFTVLVHAQMQGYLSASSKHAL